MSLHDVLIAGHPFGSDKERTKRKSSSRPSTYEHFIGTNGLIEPFDPRPESVDERKGRRRLVLQLEVLVDPSICRQHVPVDLENVHLEGLHALAVCFHLSSSF